MASRQQTLLLALLAGAMGAACWLGSVPGSLDDLFLVLRAARDPLARADWAVLGCSSLLDIGVKRASVLLAAKPESAAPWVGFALHALGCAWLFLECSRGARPRPLGRTGWGLVQGLGLLALAVACGSVPSEAAAYQLEGPVLLLCLLGMHASARRGSALLFALACVGLSWARPEGALLALAWSLLLPGSLRTVGVGSACVAALLWAGLLGALSPLPFPASTLPLSFLVKHGDWQAELIQGLGYLAAWLRTPGGLGAVLLLGAGLACGGGIPSRLALLAASLVALEGGDGYVGGRLLMPASVLALLGASEACGRGLRGAPAGLALAGVLLLAVSGRGAAVPGLRLVPSLVVPPGRGSGGGLPLELERRLVAGLRQLQAEAGGNLGVVHRDQQVLLWLDPGLTVLDASGLSEPEVAAAPVSGAVRHGRDAFAALAGRADVMLLDHQRVRAGSWAGRSLGSALLEEAESWIGRPRSASEVAAWEGQWGTASLPCGAGTWVNALVRTELLEAARRAGWVVDRAGASRP